MLEHYKLHYHSSDSHTNNFFLSMIIMTDFITLIT